MDNKLGKIVAKGVWGGEKVFAVRLTKKGMDVPIYKLGKKFKGIHDDMIRSRSSKMKKLKGNIITFYKD